jgi:hypothetical protein
MAISNSDILSYGDLEDGPGQWGVECVVSQTEMIEYALKNDPLPMHSLDVAEQCASPSACRTPGGGFRH